MRKHMSRLAFAMFLSAAGFSATLLWYQWTTPEEDGNGSLIEIADLTSTSNEVQRKRSDRLIWQAARENQILFSGESIRTSSNARAIITLKGGKGFINLEPDSVVLLETSTGQPTLELIKGNVFAKVSEGGGDSLTIKSGDQNIIVNNGEVILDKIKGGEVSVDIMTGKVDLEKGGQKISSDQSISRITPVTPRHSETISVAASSQNVTFEWKKLKPGYQVSLEAGPSAKELKLVEGASAAGEEGRLTAAVGTGRIYWRLVATAEDQTKIQSPALPLSVRVVTPPVLVEPVKAASLQWQPEENGVTFKWINSSGLSKMLIEVATDRSFKNVLHKKTVDEANLLGLEFEGAGEFFWRVSGSAKSQNGAEISVQSEGQAFSLRNDIKPKPAVLAAPQPDLVVPFELLHSTGLKFDWEPVALAASYRVNFVRAANQRNPTSQPPTNQPDNSGPAPKPLVSYSDYAKLDAMEPGTYSWTVTAMGRDQELLSESEPRTFTVLHPRPPLLPPSFAKDLAELTSPLKAERDGSADIRWLPAQGAKEYVVQLIKADGEVVWETSTEATQQRLTKLMPGQYKLVLTSKSDLGETSKPGEPLAVEVPANSQMKPPSLRKIDIE
jgi:hypothetical protein